MRAGTADVPFDSREFVPTTTCRLCCLALPPRQAPPFRWSRRLNGMVSACITPAIA